MIGTLLLFAKTLLDFIKEHFTDIRELDQLKINVTEPSLNVTISASDSMIIFANNEHFNFISYTTSSNTNCEDSDYKPIDLFWNKIEIPRLRTNKYLNLGLNNHKRMECNAGTNKAQFSETAMDARKALPSPKSMAKSPESDCNSNTLTEDILCCGAEKIIDSHDLFHDNSEYQWFLDYGYKDTAHPQSVFSVLNSRDILYYDDLARDIDANLAEVDMDDFNRSDIHSVLSTLPNMCNSDIQGVEEREMFASMSESMMIKFGLDCASPRSSSQISNSGFSQPDELKIHYFGGVNKYFLPLGLHSHDEKWVMIFITQEENSNSTSICKSELLFSPVRDSLLPNSNLSVDSLDLLENDVNLLITCQANKNNYTIAFEGSTVMGSDDSIFREQGEKSFCTTEEAHTRNCGETCRTSSVNKFTSNANSSMARSDSVYTTWSKIKQRSSEHLLVGGQPSSKNNLASPSRAYDDGMDRSSNAAKSTSLPNLFRQEKKEKLTISLSCKFNCGSNSQSDNEGHCVKLYDIQKSNNCDSYGHSTASVEESQDKPHNLNLVKLFIKQKSASHEGMSNYACNTPLFSSYTEGNKIVSQNCVCQLHCKGKELRQLKNCETQRGTKNPHKCSTLGLDDSLVSKIDCKMEITQEAENSFSESVEQITESSNQLYESEEQNSDKHNTARQLNLNLVEKSSHNCSNNNNNNNNNHQRMDIENVDVFNVNNNNSVLVSRKNKSYSDESTQENGSNTESTENLTCDCRKTQLMKNKIRLMEKSIQTSKLLENCESDGVKEVKVPAYILYPNYSLPNLEFLKEKHYIQNLDFTKIFLRPQIYKEGETTPQMRKKRNKMGERRPFSVSDIETLKLTGFKHVRDWDSLTFLLPKEYKEFLQEIPEIMSQLKDMKNVKEDLKPLFSLNTPSKKMKKRPISCDSNFFLADCRSSNFSSTATQPSSGYRSSSTMLNSNNSLATPSRNPLSGCRYDSNDSVFHCRKNTTPKSNSLLNSQGSDEPFPRPPLPRSILRNHSLDSTKYTCKTQKENANKRYSMIEFDGKSLETNENKVNRRKSTQDPYYLKSPQKNFRESAEAKSPKDDDARCKNYCHLSKKDKSDEEVNCQSFKSSSLESDMRRLEELLEISAVFGESVESFTENDVLKLRSQVSRFLTMQKNLQKVSDCLQTVNERQISNVNNSERDELCKEKRLSDIKLSQTPNNTPEHKKKPILSLGENYESDMENSLCIKCNSEECQNSDHWTGCQKHEMNFKEETYRGLKKTVSFAEKISSLMKETDLINKDVTPPNSPILTSLQATNKAFQGKSLRLVDVPISEESYDGSSADSPKRTLENSSFLLRKKDLVLDVKNAVDKIINISKANNDKVVEELSNICLQHLCPSLYAILSDGMKEEIDTPFGPIRNSVWSVIEAASQQGPFTEKLNHLVQRLNRDDILTEGLVKFNAFIFGLLNVNSLDAWFSYLRTRDSLIQKYYNNRGLLPLSNTAGAPVRNLMDQLIQIIQPLAGVKFRLDLMYQAKLLHSSLQNLNYLLEATTTDPLSPSKHLMLMKLVQSIQNSISQSSEIRKSRQLSKESENQANDLNTPKPEDKNLCRPQGINKPRPRSGCDIFKTDNTSDIAGCLKKRWSGVQLNSKLVRAFERLGEETESEYIDSLDNPEENRRHQSSIRTASENVDTCSATLNEISNTWLDTDSFEDETKEQRKNILSNLNKKNLSKLNGVQNDFENNEKLVDPLCTNIPNSGLKYKRLQQKWEKLNRKSNADYLSASNTPLTGMSPVHKPKLSTVKPVISERNISDANQTLSSPTTRISRIPRPVSSPVQTTPSSEKPSVFYKKLSFPANYSSSTNSCQKGNVKLHDNEITRTDIKTKFPTQSRVSRVDELSDPNVEQTRGRAVRPSSLPYRGASTLPARKNIPARANSASLNRKPTRTGPPRIVRTLSHRLPSDSGHLTFNEGEKLKVVLEVDETWLLCCRGTQKGLVPKSAVIAVPEHIRY